MPVHPDMHSSGLITVIGWLILSPKINLFPDYMLSTLKISVEPTKYLIADRTMPEDIISKGAQPEFTKMGFTANFDISTLADNYTLGIAYVKYGNFVECLQIRVPLTFRIK